MLRRDPGQSIFFRDSSNRRGFFHAGGPVFLTVLMTMMMVGAPQLAFGQSPAITVNLATGALTIIETDEDATGTFTVQLATEPTGDVRVRISPGRSGDVSVDDTTLDFTTTDYNIAQTVTVTVAHDDDAITDDPVTLRLTASGANYGGVTLDVKVNITEDDERGVTVDPVELTVEEGDSETYEVNLDSEPSGPVTISVDDSGDVRVSPPSLTFTTGDWDTKKEFTVRVLHDDDGVNDPNVTLTHTVSGADYDTGVAADSVTVTITDDDTQALTVTPTELAIREGSSRDYRVRLATQPTGEVTVTVGGLLGDVDVDDTTLTFTTGNWNRNQTVKVSVEEDDDALDDPDVTLTNTASGADYDTGVDVVNVTVTITDNDTPAIRVSPTSLTIPEGTEEVDDRFYTVGLTTEPTQDVTITVVGFSGTDVGVSSSTLIFTSSDWSEKKVTLTAAEDADAMTDDTVTLTHTVSTTATEYEDLTAADVRVNITENDVPSVTITPTSLTIDEGGTGTYNVVLETEPTGDVTITVGGVSGDVSVNETTLTFSPQNYSTPQPVEVSVDEDDDAVTDPVVTLTHTVRGADYQDRGVTAPAVAVTITENDEDDRGVTVSETSLTIPEGSTRTYTVVLGTEPSADVTVTVGGSTGDVNVDRSTRTLRFTDKNWDQPQTVKVNATEDDDAVTDDDVTLTHTVRGGDYADETANDVVVTITENEERGVQANPSELEIVEDGSTSYKLSLTSRPTESVTVTVTSSNTSVTVRSQDREFTLSPSRWKSGRSVTVSAAADAGNIDGVNLSHTVTGGDYVGVTGGAVSVDVKDSGTVGVAVNPTVVSVNEESSSRYTIVLTSEPTDPVTVAVGVAPEDSGVTVSPEEFTFSTSNWRSARTITVRAAQDDNTADEPVTLSHTLTSDDTNYANATASDVTVRVMDNDQPGVRISPTSLRIQEGSTKTYTVELQTQPSADVTVSVDVGDGDVTVSGTTLNTTDGKSGTLTFNQDNWNAEQTVTVEAVDDPDSDDDEVTISHTVTGATEYTEVIASAVMVTATDDDLPGVKVNPTSLVIPEGQSRDYTVVLQTVPTETVTITLGDASGDDVEVDPKTLVFSVGGWNMEQTVTVTANEDEDAADDADVTISHSVSGGNYDRVRATDVTVTIEENDLPSVTVNPTTLDITEGESDTYRVALTTQPTQNVTVTISGASGDVTVNPPTLTFNSENWEQGEEVTVSVAEDGDALPDPSVTLTHTVRGGEYAGVVPDDVVVNIEETDVSSVKIDPTSLEVPEGGSKTYTMVLTSRPTADVRVTVSGASGDVSVNKTELTFTRSNWHQEQTVMVSAAEDDDAESDDAVNLDHRVRGGDYTPVTADSVTVTIAENDSRGVKVTPTAMQIPEDGDRTYRVELTSQPTGEVTVAVEGVSPSITVSPSTWKFTTSNWDRAQTVTVSAAEDTEDPPESESVTLMNTVSGGGYDDVPAASVAVTAIDNDAPGVAVSPTALEVDEGSSTSYQIVLTQEPSGTVTIDVGGEDGDVSVSPDQIRFTTGNWNRQRTLRVSARSDLDAQTDSSVTLTHTVSGGGYQGVTASAVTVMVNETDPKSVMVNPTEMTIPAGGSQAYTVALSSEPTADVTVRVKGATLEVTTDRSRLTFTADNWRQTQSVTVSVDEDFKVTGEDLKVELSHEVSGGDYYDVDAPAVTVTVPVTGTPSAPTGLAVAAGDQSATLTWGAPADDGGSPIRSYQYRYQAAGGTYTSWRTAEGGANATTAEITGLSNGTTYNFEVQAVNATGPGRVASASVELPDGPPGAPRGLTATAGNGSITLSWNAPADGGSSILRYDYRYASADGNGSYGEWTEVEGGASTTNVTIPDLTNGVQHAFQVRAVNAIGEGDPATVNETPGAVPGAPALAARGGNGTVTLMWDAPANDGGAPILRYEVHYRESGGIWGDWMEVDGGADARSTTIRDLTNGTEYEFEVRAVNGKGDGTAASVMSMPMPGLDFAHFANGVSGDVTITSDIVLVNVQTSTVYPAVFFYNQMGEQLDAETVVDMGADLMVTEDGGVAPAMGLEDRSEITISTHGRGTLVVGSAKVFSDGRVGGMLRFDLSTEGVAGVGASEPVDDAIFPARRLESGINTGVAIRNLSPNMMTVTCRLMQGGEVLAMKPVVLYGDGHFAKFIDEAKLFGDWFASSDTPDFVGSVRCMAPEGGMFTGVALEMDLSGGRAFTTLPMVPIDAAAADDGMSTLNFAHFANGDLGTPTTSDLVFVNVANTAVGPAIYFYDREGEMIDADSVVDVMMEGVAVADDGALTVMDEIEPMGEMTISTTGMGEGVIGSVRVVSDGPIGGVLRFDIPTAGVAGVGASEAVNAAIFPVRYMAGGINTGAAIRNLGSDRMMVTCTLMQGGEMVGEEPIDLPINGQDSRFITEVFKEAFMAPGMSDFEGSVYCAAPDDGMFTGVAFEMDFVNRVFTTLPVVRVP